MNSDLVILSIILLAGMLAAVKAKKLTIQAALLGGLTAIFIYCASSFQGILLMSSFFAMGTFATSWKRRQKQQMGLEEGHRGKRGASQVFANAGVAGMAGLFALFYPDKKFVSSLVVAACFASASADTLSSELGNVYGRNYYNILTFRKDKRGLDGVISLEGTLFGFAGSAVIALLHAYFAGWRFFVLVFLAGILGNVFDSVLGASLQRQQVLNNDAVNFLNTFFAALLAVVLSDFFV